MFEGIPSSLWILCELSANGNLFTIHLSAKTSLGGLLGGRCWRPWNGLGSDGIFRLSHTDIIQLEVVLKSLTCRGIEFRFVLPCTAEQLTSFLKLALLDRGLTLLHQFVAR